jgi:hypothetical protein
MNPPETTEYAPYYNTYISLVDNSDIMSVMAAQPRELRSLIAELPEERGTYAYAIGKWTTKELLSHIIDGERIFSYRVLRISRGDTTAIEGFEQDDYIQTSNANNRTFADLLEEFDLERRANLALIRNLSDESSTRMGTASGNPVSARALVYIMAGHVRHHVGILKSRYLGR